MQLQQVRKGSLLMHEFLVKVKSIANYLTVVGDKMPKREMIMYLLHGLGDDYRGFVTSINMRSIEPIFQKVQSLLLAKEQLILEHYKFDEHQLLQANVA